MAWRPDLFMWAFFASLLLWASFVCMIVTSASPEWFSSEIYIAGGWTRMASGGFYASSFSRQIYYPYYYPYTVWMAQKNRWHVFNDTICTDPVLRKTIGDFGWCNEQDQVGVPAAAVAMQALAVTACVLLFLASIVSCSICVSIDDPTLTSDDTSDAVLPGVGVTACVGFIGMVLSAASFAVAESFVYYKQFGASHSVNISLGDAELNIPGNLTGNVTGMLNFTGGFLPIIDNRQRVSAFGPVQLERGSAYWCALSSFIMSFVAVCLLACVGSLATYYKNGEKDSDPLEQTSRRRRRSSQQASTENAQGAQPQNNQPGTAQPQATADSSSAQAAEAGTGKA